MKKYIIKRILISIPMIFLITFIAFCVAAYQQNRYVVKNILPAVYVAACPQNGDQDDKSVV